jgi:hypothetical protein
MVNKPTQSEEQYRRDMNSPVTAFDVIQMTISLPITIFVFMLMSITAVAIPPWWVSLIFIISFAFFSLLMIYKFNSRNVVMHILSSLIIATTLSIIVGVIFFGINWTTWQIELTATEIDYIAFTIIPSALVALGLDIAMK